MLDRRRAAHPHRPQRRVSGCAVSPDGTRIVSASDDETLELWDASTGPSFAPSPATPARCRAAPSAPTAPASCRPVRRDPAAVGRLAAPKHSVFPVAHGDRRAPSDVRLRLQPRRHPGRLRRQEGTLQLREAADGARSPSSAATTVACMAALLPRRHPHRLRQRGRDAQALGRGTEAEQGTFRGHPPAGPRPSRSTSVDACAFSPDGTCIVSASDDRTLRLWEQQPGRARHPHGHAGWCSAVPSAPTAPASSPPAKIRR